MTEADLRRKLAWLIGIRVAIVTLLLGSAILVQINTPAARPADPFFYLIGLTYFLTVLYAVSLRFVYRHRWLIDVQLAGDTLIVSAFIYVTGGITSYFSSLYVLPIMAASMFQFLRGGLMAAVLSTLIMAVWSQRSTWVQTDCCRRVGCRLWGGCRRSGLRSTQLRPMS